MIQEKVINELTSREINKMISDVYNEVFYELKKYTKTLILNSLGIKIDSWGHVTEISEDINEMIISQSNLEKLKTKILTNANQEIDKHLETDIEFKYNNSRIVNKIIKNSIDNINRDLLNNIEREITVKVNEIYKDRIKEQVYNNPLIAELNIRNI
jgi:ribosomal protein L24